MTPGAAPTSLHIMHDFDATESRFHLSISIIVVVIMQAAVETHTKAPPASTQNGRKRKRRISRECFLGPHCLLLVLHV